MEKRIKQRGEELKRKEGLKTGGREEGDRRGGESEEEEEVMNDTRLSKINPLKYVFSTCILAIHKISVYMFSLGISEELEKVSCKHELHDDVDWVIIYTPTQYLHNVLMVEVTVWEGG